MSSTNFLCCGAPTNPWDSIFCGGGEATQPVAYEQKQNWDNPFGVAPPQQASILDARSVDSSGTGGRSTGTYGDTRSTGSTGTTLTNKTFKDISREEKARKRAVFLSENLMRSESPEPEKGAGPRKKPSVGLSGSAMSAVHAEMIMDNNKGATTANVDDRVLATQVAAALARKIKGQIDKTETTRPKKDLAPEDVRDPETVPGMVSKAGIALEEDARKKARTMISSGKYPYHEKAGNAVWSFQDTHRIRKSDGKLNPIVQRI